MTLRGFMKHVSDQNRLAGRLAVLVAATSLLVACQDLPAGKEDANWSAFGGDKAARKFSALSEITPENVGELDVAWIYRSGDPDIELPAFSQLQVNPLVIDGIVYGLGPQAQVFALDAASGKPLWTTKPVGGKKAGWFAQKRGLIWWRDGDESRLFTAFSHQLVALEPATGQPVTSFGKDGIVDLREGLGRPIEKLAVSGSTPGVIYGDLLIMGTRVGEERGAAPGHVRAFDVRTGEIRWTFKTIPDTQEPGSDTWPLGEWQNPGGANAWAGMSLDEERGIVYLPLGSPSGDFIGINRPGANLFGNSLVALDAATGKRIWHYQVVHHDILDRDLNSQPALVTVERDGKPVDAVIQTTKQGLVYIFDRETGAPLFPIEEVPVPPSSIPGEDAWPVQPIPVLPAPFSPQVFDENQITDISEEATAYVTERLKDIAPHALFQPLGIQDTLVYPGYDGGASWGGPAWDPGNGVLYVNAMNYPSVSRLIPLIADDSPARAGERLYMEKCAACHMADRSGIQHATPSLVDIGKRLSSDDIGTIIKDGRGRMSGFALQDTNMEQLVSFLLQAESNVGEIEAGEVTDYTFSGYANLTDADGYPASKPPWGTLSAIDMNSGETLWQKVLGEHAELTARGIPQTGTRNYGGPLATASGLVFIAATSDEMIRAFDSKTGNVLWQMKLPAAGYATPATYSVKGKQYVVIAAGGGKLGTAPGDYYIAFSLP